MIMTISLKPSDQAWLTAQVAAGRFPTVEAAVAAAVAVLKDSGAAPDLAWAKPLVDASRAAITRGEGVAVADALAHWDATLADLRR